jgi:hypothetical protein
MEPSFNADNTAVFVCGPLDSGERLIRAVKKNDEVVEMKIAEDQKEVMLSFVNSMYPQTKTLDYDFAEKCFGNKESLVFIGSDYSMLWVNLFDIDVDGHIIVAKNTTKQIDISALPSRDRILEIIARRQAELCG